MSAKPARSASPSSFAARLSVALGALAAGMAALAAPAAAQGVPKGKFGNWEVRCDSPTGSAHEQCALMQSLAATDRPNLTLVVMVLKPADGKGPILRMIAPLGVWLPLGIGLSIDSTNLGRAGFVRCLASGCVADVVMDDKFVAKLDGGKTATFVLYDTPEAGVGLPLSLAGLKDGMAKLP